MFNKHLELSTHAQVSLTLHRNNINTDENIFLIVQSFCQLLVLLMVPIKSAVEPNPESKYRAVVGHVRFAV